MIGPALAAIAFGLAKGFATPRSQPSSGFRLHQDFLGPLREEVQYRGAPFAAFGSSLPYGATAASFAADHVVSDLRHTPMTTAQVIGRLGDVLLGGLAYESAYRQSGLVGAVLSHMGHNLAVGVGERLRRKR